ncbi:MAG: hypothetical protein ACYC9L_16950 [Sulfuricaulis sp.]
METSPIDRSNDYFRRREQYEKYGAIPHTRCPVCNSQYHEDCTPNSTSYWLAIFYGGLMAFLVGMFLRAQHADLWELVGVGIAMWAVIGLLFAVGFGHMTDDK